MSHSIQFNPNIKRYAPYVYLSRFCSAYTYDLYLLVPVAEGECLEIMEPDDFANGEIIHCQVVRGDENTITIGQQRYAKKHLRFDYSTDLDYLNPDELEVTVLVNNDLECLAKTCIPYKDSDIICYKPGFAHQLAVNCPYVYLQCPPNSNVNPYDYYHPRMLVPVEGYEFLSAVEELTLTSPNCGACEDIVILAPNKNKGLHMVAPPQLNKARFRDATEDEHGSFSALLLTFDDAEEAWQFIENSYEERNEILLYKDLLEGTKKTKNEIKLRTKHADKTAVFGHAVN